ncbi:MAG: hypothetical protein HEEMFOPI_02005 [Holosporales bacterium]
MKKEIDWILSKPKYIIESKLFNWPWRTPIDRYNEKEIAKGRRTLSYLNRYVPAFTNIIPVSENHNQERSEEEARIFSIWLQGEENAPAVVKACFASMRANIKHELIILDKESLFDWIELPDYVVDKWKNGKIKPAHFADICRLELLYCYGGFWLDATLFITSPLPQWLLNSEFFVYSSGNNRKLIGFHSFVQNCFIRACKNNTLIKAWRDAVLIYWQNEIKARYYFVHQLIFKKVIDCNPSLKEAYNKIPHLDQAPTHTVWFEHSDDPFDPILFEKLTTGVVFQKTEYKSSSANNPIPNSFADVLINMYK